MRHNFRSKGRTTWPKSGYLGEVLRKRLRLITIAVFHTFLEVFRKSFQCVWHKENFGTYPTPRRKPISLICCSSLKSIVWINQTDFRDQNKGCKHEYRRASFNEIFQWKRTLERQRCHRINWFKFSELNNNFIWFNNIVFSNYKIKQNNRCFMILYE